MIRVKFMSIGKVILGDVIYKLDNIKIDNLEIVKVKPKQIIGTCYLNTFTVNLEEHILKSASATEEQEAVVKILSVSKIRHKKEHKKMTKQQKMFQLGKIAKKLFNRVNYFKIRQGLK